MKITISVLLSVLLLTVLLTTSCVSETRENGALVWTENAAKQPTSQNRSERRPARPKGQEPDPTRVVEVPKEVVAELMKFVNNPKVFLADRIEVDASRIPFQMAMVPLADPGYVEKVQMGSKSANATGILLRAMNPMPQMERDFPRLRVGDGIDLFATKEIQARTYNTVNERRPMFIQVRGMGNAVYRDPSTGQRLERNEITLIAEVVPSSRGLVFRHQVR